MKKRLNYTKNNLWKFPQMKTSQCVRKYSHFLLDFVYKAKTNDEQKKIYFRLPYIFIRQIIIIEKINKRKMYEKESNYPIICFRGNGTEKI